MIISASRRTDIPFFFSDWFYRRLQDGYVCVRNPMNRHQVSRVALTPDVVDCIVFWTKNPRPMIGRLDELGAIPYYFQFTLTGYGRDVEPNVPSKTRSLIPTFQTLSDIVGPQRVVWRYDPIAFSDVYTPSYHLRAFRSIAAELEGCADRCVISFVDIYRKNKRRLEGSGLAEPDPGELLEFSRELADIAREHGISVGSCSEKIDLSAAGIEHNACVSRERIERILGAGLKVSKDKTQRDECGCVQSIDIGCYNTCGAGCLYCYANFSPETILHNRERYDVDSPLLCDRLEDDDVVRDRAMKSLVVEQKSLFDLSDVAGTGADL